MTDRILKGNCYIHFCLKNKSWMAFRYHINKCPFCGYKNPDGDDRTKSITMVMTFDGNPVVSFESDMEAIAFTQRHHKEDLILTNVGYIPR